MAIDFDQAWAATGRTYGEDALENVRLGWEMRGETKSGLFGEAWARTGRRYDRLPLEQVRLGWDMRSDAEFVAAENRAEYYRGALIGLRDGLRESRFISVWVERIEDAVKKGESI